MVVLNAQYQLAFKDYQSLKQHADNINGQADALIPHEVNELSVLVEDIDDQQFSVQEEDDLLLQQKKCESVALQVRREQDV